MSEYHVRREIVVVVNDVRQIRLQFQLEISGKGCNWATTDHSFPAKVAWNSKAIWMVRVVHDVPVRLPSDAVLLSAMEPLGRSQMS